jgi:hypothetical protein
VKLVEVYIFVEKIMKKRKSSKKQLDLFNTVKQDLSRLLLREEKKKEDNVPSIEPWKLKAATERFTKTTKNLTLFVDYCWVDGVLHVKPVGTVKNEDIEFEKLVKKLTQWKTPL